MPSGKLISALVCMQLCVACAENKTNPFNYPLADRPKEATKGETVAVLWQHEGTVWVQAANGISIKPAHDQQKKLPLLANDRVVVDQNSYAVLHLHNNRMMRLDQKTSIQVDKLAMFQAGPIIDSVEQQLTQILSPQPAKPQERIVGWHARMSAATSIPSQRDAKTQEQIDKPEKAMANQRQTKPRRPQARAKSSKKPKKVAALDFPKFIRTRNKAKRFQFQDGSRIHLSKGSQLRLVKSNNTGKTLRLQSGALACQVSKQQANKPFRVIAGNWKVTVIGTIFAVRLEGKNIFVAVNRGIVEVNSLINPKHKTQVSAGKQVSLIEKTLPKVKPIEPQMQKLLEKMVPDSPSRDPHKPLEKNQTSSQARIEPKPLAPEPKAAPVSNPSEKTQKQDKETKSESDAFFESGINDGWVIDTIKQELRAEKWESALHKLSNYLEDPASPEQAQATYLKAVCYQKLGRQKQAQKMVHRLIQRWPDSKYTRAAQKQFPLDSP